MCINLFRQMHFQELNALALRGGVFKGQALKLTNKLNDLFTRSLIFLSKIRLRAPDFGCYDTRHHFSQQVLPN